MQHLDELDAATIVSLLQRLSVIIDLSGRYERDRHGPWEGVTLEEHLARQYLLRDYCIAIRRLWSAPLTSETIVVLGFDPPVDYDLFS